MSNTGRGDMGISGMGISGMGIGGMSVGGMSRGVTKDFCNMEMFNVTCNPDEIILMHRARYGRMQIGRCVKRSLGFLGCAVDVLHLLDQRCSGRQNCSFIVPYPVLHNINSCPDDTTPYLEVSYKCLIVSQTGTTRPRCNDDTPIILSASSGYISSSLTTLWGVGTSRCPWKIRVSPGQFINFTIYNFNGLPTDLSSNQEKYEILLRPDVCYEYAVIKEEGGKLERISLCGGEKRESRLFTSTRNESKKNILLFYYTSTAIGCPDLPVPEGAHVTRKGDNVTVTCSNGHEVWYLTCKDTKWQGQLGNCSKGTTSASMFNRSSDFPFGILLVVAIGVALGVFLGGLLLVLAVLYMKRRHRRYMEEEYRAADAMSPQYPYHPDQKAAMMINIHSDTSPHWDHVAKSVDSDDAPLRDPSCRACAMPYMAQTTIALGTPPVDRRANITGPADVPHTEPISRHHIYECPKFS
ncbi:hypothetical protein LSH36_475g02079 [Paralvinella palmiformis]|uniref:SUEL-type lectin domain-containing protein n=1 Tax=Paralvinella palmiformis TaxID=53620 RepID=A0AAD9MZN7_9ANNE|nr:hypothetical protein LSH36_475g02079 [Paralvinella palmiformis]